MDFLVRTSFGEMDKITRPNGGIAATVAGFGIIGGLDAFDGWGQFPILFKADFTPTLTFAGALHTGIIWAKTKRRASTVGKVRQSAGTAGVSSCSNQ